MRHHRYSLHKIRNVDDIGFSADEYSLFKFGDDKVAKEFGTSLALGFAHEVLAPTYANAQLVIFSSPYSFIPTATFAMKRHFVFQLNRWLVTNKRKVVQESKIHRTITYKEDYGALDAAQRMSLISNDFFHIDASFLEGKVLLFLDDIKITGSHERMILKMIDKYDLKNDVHMLYFAELVNSDIHPRFENELNYHQVKSIFDLDKIIKSGHFCINTRMVKYLLNYSHLDFCAFIEGQSNVFINQLFDMAIGNNYHTMDSYSLNLSYLKNILFSNQYKLMHHGN